MKCKDKCKELDISCPVKECKYSIDYEEDLNCCLVSIEKNGTLTLREVSERLDISFVRVKQIEDSASRVLKKRLKMAAVAP